MQLRFRNLNSSASNFTFTFNYRVDGGAVKSMNYSTNLGGFSVLTLNHDSLYDFSAQKNYNVDVWVDAIGDPNPNNDSLLNQTINNSNNPPRASLPFTEDFETFTPISAPFSFDDMLNNGWTRYTNSTSATPLVWNITQGPTGSGTTGPTQGYGNQNSNYAYLEVSAGQQGDVAYLESPCISLPSDKNVEVSFYLHKYGGNMGNFRFDIYDGNNWIALQNISGQLQNSSSDPFRPFLFSLSQFRGRVVKFRFVGFSQGCCAGDMAVDQLEIIPVLDYDLALTNVIRPLSGDCNGSSVNPSAMVQITNVGSQSFNLTNTTRSIQVEDGPISQFSGSTFSLPNGTNIALPFGSLSNLVPGEIYKVKFWIDDPLDGNPENDTIVHFYQHQLISETFEETFDIYTDAFCDAGRRETQLPPLYTLGEEDYFWNLQSSKCESASLYNPGFTTGPYKDHSGDGNYLFATAESFNGIVNGDSATLLLPCISSSLHPRTIEIWYHTFNSAGQIKVINDNSCLLGRIYGYGQSNADDDWEVARFPLFNTSTQQIMLSASYNGSGSANMPAVDDIKIFKTIAQDIAIDHILSPGNSCSNSGPQVRVELYNRGSQTIVANSLQLNYILNSQNVTETVSSSIASNTSLVYTFNTPPNLNFGGKRTIRVTANLNGDTLLENNVLEKEIEVYQPQLPYFQNFENLKVGINYPSDELNGWSRIGGSLPHVWRAWQGPGNQVNGFFGGPTNIIPPNGPSGDHTYANSRKNGWGNYLKLQHQYLSSPVPDAVIVSPCGPIDFSGTTNQDVLLSYYYHYFASPNLSPILIVDVHNGTQWINGIDSITSPQQSDDLDAWKKHRVSLSQFGSNQNVQFRFRVKRPSGANYSAEIGIDDVELKDRIATDVSIDDVLPYVTSRCGFSSQSIISFVAFNEGRTAINSNSYSYAIRYTDFEGNDSLFNTVTETISSNINPLDTNNLFFQTTADLSKAGNYDIKIWSNNANDIYKRGDTLNKTITNTQNQFPYYETFSHLEENEAASDYRDQRFSNGWTSFSGIDMKFIATSLAFPGHTGDFQDKYLYVDGRSFFPGQSASVNTNCVDINSSNHPVLNFWYRGDGYVNVNLRNNNGPYFQIDTLKKSRNEWKRFYYAIEDKGIKAARIYFQNRQSEFAIDDFSFREADSIGIRLDEIVEPISLNCNFNGSSTFAFKVFNDGANPIDSIRAEIEISTVGPQGAVVASLNEWIVPSTPIPAFSSDTLSFSNQISLSSSQNYLVDLEISVKGEGFLGNNSLEEISLDQSPISWNDTITFGASSYQPGQYFWSPAYDPNFNWSIGIGNTGGQFTGPADDHTPDSDGRYLYTYFWSAGGSTIGKQIFFNSRCIDLSNFTQPKINYWYHMYGNQMGDLFFDLNDGSGWIAIDSIKGQVQNSSSAPWNSRSVDISTYSNQNIQFRFRTVAVGQYAIIALDDIFISDSSIIIGLESPDNLTKNLSIYPNPNQGQFTLKVPEDYVGMEYQILDLSGKTIERAKLEQQNIQLQLDVDKGVYILQIPDKGVSRKVVVY